jgi:preprotein translocase subunit SecF
VVDLFRTRHWDLVGRRNFWFALSLLVIVPGVIALVAKGLNYGIDFTGGGLITYQLATPLTASQASSSQQVADDIKSRTGVNVRVQLASSRGGEGGADQVLVRTSVPQGITNSTQVLGEQAEKIGGVLQADYPGVKEVARDMVSPVVSKELVWNAIYSVFFGCIFILLWIRIRYFSFQWAVAGVIALVHDVLLLIGMFALLQREVNSPFVAAVLTVVGFSVHDTIIIFDRIRENLRLRKGSSFAETTNISLLETLARSVNTVLTVELVLVAVFFFGGASLRDFTLALIIGVTAGAYSSIFNASQLLVVMKIREERATAARRAAQTARGRAAVAKSRPASAQSQAEDPRPAKPAPSQAVSAAAAAGNGEETAAPTGESAADQAARATRAKKLKATGKRKRRF